MMIGAHAVATGLVLVSNDRVFARIKIVENRRLEHAHTQMMTNIQFSLEASTVTSHVTSGTGAWRDGHERVKMPA